MAGGLTIKEAKRLSGPLIYGLADESGVFYVGQTRSPKNRFQQHAERRGRNEALKQRVLQAGDALRVIVLRDDPPDLNAAEREEIRARAGALVNLIGADDARWALSDTKPWAAGTGTKSPVSYALAVCRPHIKEAVRQRLAEMSKAERCRFEIETLLSFPAGVQRRFERWLNVTREKMIACMEAADVAA